MWVHSTGANWGLLVIADTKFLKSRQLSFLKEAAKLWEQLSASVHLYCACAEQKSHIMHETHARHAVVFCLWTIPTHRRRKLHRHLFSSISSTCNDSDVAMSGYDMTLQCVAWRSAMTYSMTSTYRRWRLLRASNQCVPARHAPCDART